MLWRIFADLLHSRRWTDFGSPLPISYTEIEAWSRVNSYRISLNDLALLRVLDVEYRTAMADSKSSSPDADDDWTMD